MSLGVKVLCFSTGTNGLVEILHCSELLVSSAQLGSEFVQTYQPMRGLCFSSLVEVFHCSKLVVTSPAMCYREQKPTGDVVRSRRSTQI